MKRELNFVGKKKIFFIISACLLLLTVLATVVFGARLSVQFKGGSIATYSFTGDIDKGKVAKVVKDTIKEDVTVTESTNLQNNTKNLVITLSKANSLSVDNQTKLTDALQKEYKDNKIELMKIDNVDPTIGKEFFMKCLVALIAASLLIILYIGIRFRKIGGISAGVMGVVALIHDSIMVYATFVICGFPINDNFIAAILTILGFSINDTIVIYDRIRENEKAMSPKTPIGELVNVSINQSLTRALNTTITTVAALLVVCIVSVVCHVDSIIDFVFPMMIGMISGVYSSLCLSGPLWVAWKEHQEKKKLAQKSAKGSKKK